MLSIHVECVGMLTIGRVIQLLIQPYVGWGVYQAIGCHTEWQFD